jgi:CBS-domain-containing membrane protein
LSLWDLVSVARVAVVSLIPRQVLFVFGLIRVVFSCSVLESLDAILSGAQALAVPLRAGGQKKQLGGGGRDFCWLTQEDLVRYFLNSIGLFYHVAARSVSSLGLVRADFLSVRPHESALSTVPLIRRAVASETAVAVVTEDGHLVGEISPALLAACDETAAAAVATLSVADLMAYVDYFGSPPDHILHAIKAGLKNKCLDAMLELMEDGTLSSFSLSSASSSDDETGRTKLRRPSSGSYGRRSAEEPVVCSPASSLVAVMVQALAHRVNYLWVVNEDADCRLAGIVTFSDVLRVFREQLQ